MIAAAALVVLGALGVLGYVLWQRWQASSSEQVAEAETTTTVPGSMAPLDLVPAVDPGVAPVAPAVPQAPLPPAPKAAPKATSTAPAARKPEPSYEPLPSPVPPTVITPQLAPASPEVQAKPSAPPVMFGGVKWMRVDGSHVKEVGAFLQIADNEVRVLDDRVRTSLVRVPLSAISHVAYSSGKRPAWRKDVGPVPIESAFDTTVRTFHYIAFQGGSQFLLVRIKDDDLPRMREELKKRANLGVETVR